MELMYNLAIAFILLGLFFMVKNTGQRMFWSGIGCIALGVGIIITAANTEISHDLIGTHVITDTKAEYLVEMRFFKLKTQAVAYYQKQKISDYSLCYRLAGDTAEFFKMIGGQPSLKSAKRVRFTANKSKQKTGFEIYQDYFLSSNLVPENANLKQK